MIYQESHKITKTIQCVGRGEKLARKGRQGQHGIKKDWKPIWRSICLNSPFPVDKERARDSLKCKNEPKTSDQKGKSPQTLEAVRPPPPSLHLLPHILGVRPHWQALHMEFEVVKGNVKVVMLLQGNERWERERDRLLGGRPLDEAKVL